MSVNYSRGQKKSEFIHDNPIMSKTHHFLLMKTKSCIENAQKLFMSNQLVKKTPLPQARNRYKITYLPLTNPPSSAPFSNP